MPTEHSQCQQNVLHDSNVSQMRHNCDSIGSHFVYRIHCLLLFHNHSVRCYKTSSREQIIGTSIGSIRLSKNWRKKHPIMILFPFSECQKIPYRHGKRTKTKSLKSINVRYYSLIDLNSDDTYFIWRNFLYKEHFWCNFFLN